MTADRNRNYPDAERSLMVRGEANTYLPSTEVREVVPGFNDEIDLRDYLDMLVRRKTAVLSVLAVVFLLVALNTFLATPQFKAKGVIRASNQNSTVTKFENLDKSDLRTLEFQQTQVNLLQSNQLATRVIEKLDLAHNPVFNPAAADKRRQGRSRNRCWPASPVSSAPTRRRRSSASSKRTAGPRCWPISSSAPSRATCPSPRSATAN